MAAFVGVKLLVLVFLCTHSNGWVEAGIKIQFEDILHIFQVINQYPKMCVF